MTVEARLLQALQAAPVVALVGARIFFDRADQDTPAPFVVLGRDTTADTRTLATTIDNPDVLFDVRCWAETRLQAEQIAAAVKAAVEAVYGGVTERTAGYSDEVALHCAILKVVID